MRYFIYSPLGLSLFLVPRLAQSDEVDKIYFYCGRNTMNIARDLDKVPGWEKIHLLKEPGHPLNHVTQKSANKYSGHIPTTDSKDDLIIIFDDNGYGEMADFLKRQGFKVIGGGRFDDKMESDRTYAADFMKKFMKVPETFTFNSFKDGLNFLKTQDKEARFVFKPHNADVPKEYTYVSKDVSDMVSFMAQVKDDWIWEETFQLQTFIKGTEVDFNAYFNGEDWMKNSMMIYFENKPIGNDDKGPATGGSIAVQMSRPLEGKFYDILDKVKPYLQKVKFRGVFAINSIVDEKGDIYFIELTPRFGYPSFPLDITLLEDNGHTTHEFFKALTSGETKSFFPTNKVAATISIFSFHSPDSDDAHESVEGTSISWDKKWDKYFFPYYIMGDKGKMVLSGDSGWVCQSTCVDTTLDGAVAMLYDTYMPTFKMTDAYYRTDLGKDAKRRIKELHDKKII